MGFPVRLIVPNKYAYKSALVGCTFTVYPQQRVRLLGTTRIQ